MGNSPSDGATNKTEQAPSDARNRTVAAGTVPVVTAYPATAPPPYCSDGSLTAKEGLPPLPRKDVPKGAISIPFVHSGRDHPKGIMHWLGTDGLQSSYLNPLSRGKCEVTASSIDVGILPTLVANDVGIFSTSDADRPWFMVSLDVGLAVYVDHYVLGGSETGRADDMMRDWVLEGSNNAEQWHLLRQHTADPVFLNAPNGWECFAVAPAEGYRHFRISHTGVTLSGSRSLLASGFELFGHLVDQDQ